MPSPDDLIAVTMSRREALGLEKLAEVGLQANGAFNLIANTASGEHALSLLRAAIAGDQRGPIDAPAKAPRQKASFSRR